MKPNKRIELSLRSPNSQTARLFARGSFAALDRKAVRVIAFALVLLVAACTRGPSMSDAQAQAVAEAAAVLLRGEPNRDVAQEAWSSEVRALNPKAVRVTVEGVYVVTDSWFVEEAGFFVPRHPETFVAADGTDPEYKRIRGAVFSYRIRG